MKKQKKTKKTRTSTKKSSNQKTSNPAKVIEATWLREIICLALISLIALVLYHKIPAYEWIVNTHIKNNLSYFKKYKTLTDKERITAKLGINHQYAMYIKEQTQEDAVILLPSKETLLSSTTNNQFASGNKSATIANRVWISNFIYPRKVIYENELSDQNKTDITHVGIVNGWGYQYVPSPPSNKPDNLIIALK